MSHTPRWYQCPRCGSEYWTVSMGLCNEKPQRLRDCWLCGTRAARRFLYAVQAGSAHGPRWWDRLEDTIWP